MWFRVPGGKVERKETLPSGLKHHSPRPSWIVGGTSPWGRGAMGPVPGPSSPRTTNRPPGKLGGAPHRSCSLQPDALHLIHSILPISASSGIFRDDDGKERFWIRIHTTYVFLFYIMWFGRTGWGGGGDVSERSGGARGRSWLQHAPGGHERQRCRERAFWCQVNRAEAAAPPGGHLRL